MMDLAAPSAELERLMDDMLAFNLRWIDKWTVLEYDGLHFADDWGEQARLMIRPATWRKLFKPRYAEMFKKVHDAGMDVSVPHRRSHQRHLRRPDRDRRGRDQQPG